MSKQPQKVQDEVKERRSRFIDLEKMNKKAEHFSDESNTSDEESNQ